MRPGIRGRVLLLTVLHAGLIILAFPMDAQEGVGVKASLFSGAGPGRPPVGIPPIDASAPVKFEKATFALG